MRMYRPRWLTKGASPLGTIVQDTAHAARSVQGLVPDLCHQAALVAGGCQLPYWPDCRPPPRVEKVGGSWGPLTGLQDGFPACSLPHCSDTRKGETFILVTRCTRGSDSNNRYKRWCVSFVFVAGQRGRETERHPGMARGVLSLLEVEFWLALFTALLADELVYLCFCLSRPPSIAFLRRRFCRDGASFAHWTGD